MTRGKRVLFPLALAAVLCTGALPPGHDVPARSGHPRLLFTAADLPALRAKVAASGSYSKSFFDPAMANTYRPSRYVPGYAANPNPGTDLIPAGIYDVLLCSPPILACLHPDPEQRRLWGRYAIESSLAAIRTMRPPYKNGPEWWGRGMAHWLALTYDCCYDQLSASERAELQEELQQVCAAYRFTLGATNHGIASATATGLSALALDGDVPAGAKKTVTETLVHDGSLPADFCSYHEIANDSTLDVRLVGAPVPFVKDVDYKVQYQRFIDAQGSDSAGYALVWQSGRPRPSAGQSFLVTYNTYPDPVFWKDVARSAAQANLDRMWMGGAPAAGVFYGGWTLNYWMTDLVEAFRLNSPYDFSLHPNLGAVTQWLPTELLGGGPFRANNRNDSNYGDVAGLAGSYGPHLAWAMSRYAGDSRAAAANWLLRRKPIGGYQPWREALWVTEAFGGPTAPAPAPSVPLSGFFRGSGLANFRTGDWNGPSNEWSLLAMQSGPWMGEHDQIDRGSFTFYAWGEDFAVDTGYAFSDPRNDATAGHNSVLIDGAGQPGPFCFSEMPEAFLSGFCDAAHADLRRSFVNSNSLNAPDPAVWPVRKADRYALLVKVPGRAPYALVADDLEKDGNLHAFEWGMHTQAGNTVSYLPDGFSIWGRSARMDLHLASSSPLTYGMATWTGSSIGTHTRLKATATGTANPRFLALLDPEKNGPPALQPALSRQAGFTLGTVALPAGGKDWILFNDSTGTVSAGGISTDAALALVRIDANGMVASWTLFGGTSLTSQGRVLWSAPARGSASWDGVQLSVSADDAVSFEACAPGAASFRRQDDVLPGTLSGTQLTWRGDRRLGDVRGPAPAMAEGFSTGVSPGWSVFNDGGYTRSVGGSLCSQGLRESWLSFTNRSLGSLRGDLGTAPRAVYGDATLGGEFSLQGGGSSSPLVFYARVSDRSFPAGWPPAVDQDSVRFELFPASGAMTAYSRRNGVEAEIATAFGAPLSWGTVHTYSLKTDGDLTTFFLDGIEWVHTTAPLPARGYFQWKLPYGLHVHLDNMKVELPGATQAAKSVPAPEPDPLPLPDPEPILLK